MRNAHGILRVNRRAAKQQKQEFIALLVYPTRQPNYHRPYASNPQP